MSMLFYSVSWQDWSPISRFLTNRNIFHRSTNYSLNQLNVISEAQKRLSILRCSPILEAITVRCLTLRIELAAIITEPQAVM